MLVGLAIFYVVDPITVPGVFFLLAAIILEAASVALCPKDDQGPLPSSLLLDAAPVSSQMNQLIPPVLRGSVLGLGIMSRRPTCAIGVSKGGVPS